MIFVEKGLNSIYVSIGLVLKLNSMFVILNVIVVKGMFLLLIILILNGYFYVMKL